MTKECEVLKLALETLESSRVFVMSREMIKQPEGADWYDNRITAIREALAQPAERNFCPRCGKRTADLATIHTCTPPQIDPNNRGFPWTQKHNPAPQLFAAMPSNILPPQRMTEDGIDPNQWAFDNGLEST
jgi:hypothetical protein